VEETPEYTIDDLPDEILLEIFKYLDFFDLENVKEVSLLFNKIAQDPALMQDPIFKSALSPEAFRFSREYCRSQQKAAQKRSALKIIALGNSSFPILPRPKEDTELQPDKSIEIKHYKGAESLFKYVPIDVIRMIMEYVPDKDGERARLSRVCKQFFRAYYGTFGENGTFGKKSLNQAHYKTPELLRSLIKQYFPMCQRLGLNKINKTVLKMLINDTALFKHLDGQNVYPKTYNHMWPDCHQPIKNTLAFLKDYKGNSKSMFRHPRRHHSGTCKELIQYSEFQKPTVNELFVKLAEVLETTLANGANRKGSFILRLTFILQRLLPLITSDNSLNSTENNNNRAPPPQP